MLAAGGVANAESAAEKLFHQAQKAEHDGQIVQAYILYAEAAAADPTNIDYWARAQALRPAASMNEASPAKLPTLAPEKMDRTLFGKITEADIEQARQPLPPAKLEVEPGRRDYDLHGDSKALWEQVAAILHLKVLFDPDYKPTAPFRFQLTDADYREALNALESATDSFLVPVSPQFIFVANDSTQKRTQFERTAAVVLPFPETIDPKEIQDLANAIRGALDIRRLTVDPVQHLILVRDAVTKVRLARKMLADLLRPRPQVTVEIEILTTDVSSTLNYGLSLPTSFAISSFVNQPNLTNAYNFFASSYSTFLAFGGGASMLGLGITSAQLFATVSKSNSEAVYDAKLAAVDGLPAQLHVGEKYPIITAGYYGNTAGVGTVYTPPPTINFEDLGLVMKVTPHIVSSDEVFLDVDAEFKMLGATTSNGIPIILNTQYQSKVDVAAGEWAVLSGLMTAQEAKAITGFPLLSYIPFMKNKTITKDEGATLIVLKPHVTVAPPAENAEWSAWAGSETRLATEF
jgi:general secretion pathway protein D